MYLLSNDSKNHYCSQKKKNINFDNKIKNIIFLQTNFYSYGI